MIVRPLLCLIAAGAVSALAATDDLSALLAKLGAKGMDLVPAVDHAALEAGELPPEERHTDRGERGAHVRQDRG